MAEETANKEALEEQIAKTFGNVKGRKETLERAAEIAYESHLRKDGKKTH